jgi:hypothetical protein
MAEFITVGPFSFQPLGWPQQRIYTRLLAEDFCNRHPDVLDSAGCYVFALKASQGYKPWYIGKTDTSFRSEAFTNDKLQKYNEAVSNGQRGTGLLFFLVAPGRAGQQRHRRISELERYLIQDAAKKNPDLVNVHGANAPDWGIRGILRSRRGSANAASGTLKKVMSW